MNLAVVEARTITLMFASLFLSGFSASAGEEIKDQSRFCVQTGSDWTLQNYPPLIDTAMGTSYVQVVTTGTWLSRVFVKRYTPRFALTYEYKFNESGQMTATNGRLQRWGEWYVEADLYPSSDGTISHPVLKYRLTESGEPVVTPDDAGRYAELFDTVPVYRTVDSVPCVVLLREAEKKHATQE